MIYNAVPNTKKSFPFPFCVKFKLALNMYECHKASEK